MNPFNLPGPDFLGLYIGLLIGLVILGIWLRRYLNQPDESPDVDGIQLDPYEVAYLANGEPLVINGAMAQLVHANILGVTSTGKLSTTGDLPESAHTVERAVYNAVKVNTGCSVREVHST